MADGEVGRLLGVEEEFLLVDPSTGTASAVAGPVLMAAEAEHETDLTGELQREQIETGTLPRRSLDDLHRELLRTRAQARGAAAAAGAALAPLATSPLPVRPTTSPASRYRQMVERFGLTGSEQLTCGCHVHIAIESDDEGVAVLDRIRPWLAPVLALSSNSPFWNGEDTHYASFRSQVWERWPSAGPTTLFGDADAYRAVEKAMLATDAVDTGMIYFDARISRSHPTVEIRVADVCREIDDTVLVAGLCRALVETAVRDWHEGGRPDPVPVQVLRLASWRAGRSGLSETLLDPRTGRPAPADTVVEALVEHVRDALENTGDLDTVCRLLDQLRRRGTGAARQRDVARRLGDLRSVVIDAVDEGQRDDTCVFHGPWNGDVSSDLQRSAGEREEPAVPNPSIKDEKTYEKVREQGASKEKAARVANASAAQGRKTVSKRGGRSSSYDDMSKDELYQRAKKVGIKGRSGMSKKQLAKALRDH